MDMHFDNRALIIGVNIKNHTDPHIYQEHIFADVILIDKSHDILNPLLYQVRNEAMHTQTLSEFRRHECLSLDPHAFAMIGEVTLIDKQKKIIHLKNGNTVSYKHLILASGLTPTSLGSVHEEELSAGFHALTEALRVSSHAAQLLNHPAFDPVRKQHKIPTRSRPKHQEEPSFLSLIKKIPPSSFSKTSLDMALPGPDRRLYEVHL